MIPKNYLVVGLIIIIAITGGIFIGSKITGKSVADIDQPNNPMSNQPIKNKQNCPFECCIGVLDYNDKVCNVNYECINNKCVAIDSDNDGLTDIEEKDFGSNPSIYDTDSDGLNDYAEKQRGTNPINMNTDGDRYNDNTDINPITKNSAVISIQIINQELNWDILGILKIFEGNLNIRIATLKADVSIRNNGDDYSEYTKFDIVFKIINNEVKRVPESISRLNVGEMQNKHYEYELKLADIPNTLIDAIQQKSNDWTVEIQNVNYERF